MCHFCAEHPLDDALLQVRCHGYKLLQPNCELQYAVTWDGRPVAVGSDRAQVIESAKAQAEQQTVGRWETMQRGLGPWEPLEPERPKTGQAFWVAQYQPEVGNGTAGN